VSGLPLSGVRVLDLSTLLPGSLATLMLADTGADVVKIELPGAGDEMCCHLPRFGEASANYAVLNRGKRAYTADLKEPTQQDWVLALATEADLVVEQFRPGVMDRLGLGHDEIRSRNQRVVYCSITGYGPTGPLAQRAGRDLNYLAESGLLSVVTDRDGAPSLPVSVLADIVGGTYPAVVNILLALRRRDATGEGAHLQVAMSANLHVLADGYFATHQAGGGWPRPGSGLLTGGSPRYRICPTADGRYIACAALESRFWERLVDLIRLDGTFPDDVGQEQAVIAALSGRFANETADHWRSVLEGEDVRTVVVATWEEMVASGLVDVAAPERVAAPAEEGSFPTLPSPLAPTLRDGTLVNEYPHLAPLEGASPWLLTRLISREA
jgi:alpha-methylacyl-CoA racemase